MTSSPERSLLLGLLIDVSASMKSSIANPSGPTLTRLQSVREALHEFADRGRSLSRSAAASQAAQGLKVFAYGFGFDGPLSLILGGPRVQDLLKLSDEPSTVPIDQLADNWDRYQKHIEDLALRMLGSTPMREALEVAQARLESELSVASGAIMPALFILSDGDPTDDPRGMIPQIASQLKDRGVLIVSCYVTSNDVTEPRHLYGTASLDWPAGARLMFNCASVLPPNSPFDEYFSTHSWVVEPGARLFAQINQSTILSEFLSLLLSPLQPAAQPALLSRRASLERQLAQRQQTLLHLQEQAAIFPMGSVPVHLLNQIEAEKTMISELQQALAL